jgi:S1-C subfamily serine protease
VGSDWEVLVALSRFLFCACLLASWSAGAGTSALFPRPASNSNRFQAALSPGAAPPLCSGDYAEDLGTLSPAARDYDRQPQGQYTFCVRNTATYECVSYSADGNLKKTRRKAVAHGTAFAYRNLNGETLLLTNQHVAEWPAVTDEDHPVGDVPMGCKRVSDSLKIVDNESDAYERDDIPLTHVVADPKLDVAVLKAHADLPVLPWKIGRSASLRERDVVDVRGFPLGAFKATNVGKVISAYDHDDDRDWNHDDFVIDALLSPGNSGSPVLAVSCKTGEFELVGIYHAGYTGGSALNVVVAIDQVRDLMTSLKRAPHLDASPALDAKARAALLGTLPPYVEPFFAFGFLTAMVRARPDGALVFEVFNREFPIKAFPVLVLEDLAPKEGDGFGSLGRVWWGNRQGLKAYARSELDGETQAQVGRILEALRKDALNEFSYLVAWRAPTHSREEFDRVARLEHALKKNVSARQDLTQMASDLAERLAPHGSEFGAPVAEAFAPLVPLPIAAIERTAVSPLPLSPAGALKNLPAPIGSTPNATVVATPQR